MPARKPKPAAPPAYQVFVSHATADKWVARTLCEKIDAVAGARTFRDDRDIAGGDDIPDELRGQIRASAELVVLMTPASLGRPWVMLEIGAAWELGLLIVPICYHVGVDQVPAILAPKKAYPLNDFDRYLGELAGRAGRPNRTPRAR